METEFEERLELELVRMPPKLSPLREPVDHWNRLRHLHQKRPCSPSCGDLPPRKKKSCDVKSAEPNWTYNRVEIILFEPSAKELDMIPKKHTITFPSPIKDHLEISEEDFVAVEAAAIIVSELTTSLLMLLHLLLVMLRLFLLRLFLLHLFLIHLIPLCLYLFNVIS